MRRKQILVYFGIFLLGCSCTPTLLPDIKMEGIQPIWGAKLPGNAGVYNAGLVGLPIYDGNILFHSTYSTGIINDVFEEDNRIHSLDMESGEIKWTYPTSYNKDKPFCFSGVPYQYNEFLVAKMWKQGSIKTDKLVGLNLKTGKELFYKEIPVSNSYITNPIVVGDDTDFYYFEQTNKNAILCKGDVVSGLTNAALEILPEQSFNYTEVASDLYYDKTKKLIIVGAKERNSLSSDDPLKDSYIYIIDVANNFSIKKVLFETNNGDKSMYIARIYCDGDKVYAACGLTTICYNLNSQIIEWTYKSTESYNYMTNRIVVNENVVFLYGDNRYVGLNAETGEKMYQGDTRCSNANAFNGYAYVIGNEAKLHIIDIKTGKVLYRITCPEKALPNPKWGGGFSGSCQPQVYGDKLYVFSHTSAYCYDAVPKELDE